MEIKIIAVGKIKEEYLRDGIKDILKELNKNHKVTIVEVADEKTSENASEKEENMVKEIEGESILQKISDEDYVICMDLAGSLVNSQEFEKVIVKAKETTRGNVTFVIGGSLGLSDKVKGRAKTRIKFSKMTYPHQLFRLILMLEISKNL